MQSLTLRTQHAKRMTWEKQGKTHQTWSKSHRTIEGWRKDRLRQSQTETGEDKTVSTLHFLPPLLPSQAAACLSSSLLVVLFLTHSLLPPAAAAALRRGVENQRYNALPLSLLPLAPTLLFWSPCAEHALLPALSLKWDALASLLFISSHCTWMISWHLALIW